MCFGNGLKGQAFEDVDSSQPIRPVAVNTSEWNTNASSRIADPTKQVYEGSNTQQDFVAQPEGMMDGDNPTNPSESDGKPSKYTVGDATSSSRPGKFMKRSKGAQAEGMTDGNESFEGDTTSRDVPTKQKKRKPTEAEMAQFLANKQKDSNARQSQMMGGMGMGMGVLQVGV